MPDMPSVTQIEYILAVHKTGHFGRAAAELGVSQPTLSAQIQKVEAELGLVLLDRQAKRIGLTDHGEALVERMRALVVAHQQLVAATDGALTELRGPYTLGIIPTLAPYALPWFLSDFAAAHSAVELTILEMPTDEILVELAAGRMDAALLATPLGEPSILERVLFYDPFYLYAHASDPLLEEDAFDVTELESNKLWLLEDGHCVRAQVISLCGIHQRSPLESVRFAGGSFETLRHLIDASGGYTLVPETYARTLPRGVRQKQIRPFADRIPTREVSLVRHRQSWKINVFDGLTAAIGRNTPRAFQRELADEEVLPIRASAR